MTVSIQDIALHVTPCIQEIAEAIDGVRQVRVIMNYPRGEILPSSSFYPVLHFLRDFDNSVAIKKNLIVGMVTDVCVV